MGGSSRNFAQARAQAASLEASTSQAARRVDCGSRKLDGVDEEFASDSRRDRCFRHAEKRFENSSEIWSEAAIAGIKVGISRRVRGLGKIAVWEMPPRLERVIASWERWGAVAIAGRSNGRDGEARSHTIGGASGEDKQNGRSRVRRASTRFSPSRSLRNRITKFTHTHSLTFNGICRVLRAAVPVAFPHAHLARS